MQWNRFTKFLALAAVLASFGSFASEAARAQGPGPVKVGVINFQQALLDTEDVKKSAEELQAKY